MLQSWRSSFIHHAHSSASLSWQAHVSWVCPLEIDSRPVNTSHSLTTYSIKVYSPNHLLFIWFVFEWSNICSLCLCLSLSVSGWQRVARQCADSAEKYWGESCLWRFTSLRLFSRHLRVKTQTHQTDNKERAVREIGSCVVFFAAAVRTKSSSVHTPQTAAGAQQARPCCSCAKANPSLPIHKLLLWWGRIFWTHAH